MEKFTKLTSTMLPLPQCDVDTDQIIPATYLKVTNKDGLAEGLFARWCYKPDGTLDPDFALNQPQYQGAQVLVAGDNFGTGSSREHAPWALLGRGFRVVVSTSFADIFRNNALKNGLLPVVVDEQTHQQLISLATEDPNSQIEIDLAEQSLKLPDDRIVTFPIDSFSKICLLEGVDQLGYLLNHEPEIAAYEENWVGDRFYERGLG
jgi:3-isopropylmalate/(R)-2-methylmalate dehydratase small subunit